MHRPLFWTSLAVVLLAAAAGGFLLFRDSGTAGRGPASLPPVAEEAALDSPSSEAPDAPEPGPPRPSSPPAAAEEPAPRDPAPEATAEVTGRFVLEDGSPAEGIHVAAAQYIEPEVRRIPPDGSPLRTGADGRFRLEGLTRGPFHLAAGRHGLVLDHWALEAPAEDLEFVVESPPEPHRIEGRVHHEETGLAVEGVRVRFEWRMGLQAVRDMDLSAMASRMAPPGAPRPTPTPTPTAAEQMERTATRAVFTAVPDSVEPVTALSGPGGRFEVPALIPGRYFVALEESGYFLFRAESNAPRVWRPRALGGWFDVPHDWEAPRRLDLFVHEGRDIRGRIVYQGTQEPLEGETLQLLVQYGAEPEVAQTAVSDEEGRFVFRNADIAHTHSVSVEGLDPSLIAGDARIGGAGDGSRALFFELAGVDHQITITVRRQATVTVTVLWPDGKPAAGADVSFTRVVGVQPGASERVRADSAGQVRFPILSGHSYYAEARTISPPASAWESIRTRTELPEEVTLRLGAPGTVSGRVVDQDGRSVARAEVVMSSPGRSELGDSPLFGIFTPGTEQDSRGLRDRTTSDGRFRFINVPKGSYTIHASHGDNRTEQPVTVSIEDGEEKSGAELVLHARDFTLRGRVVDTDDEPIDGVSVSVVTDNVYRQHATTGPDGRFAVEGLPRRPGRIMLRAEGFLSPREATGTDRHGAHEYELVDREQTFVLEALDRRRLEVTVLDDVTGQPAEDYEIARPSVSVMRTASPSDGGLTRFVSDRMERTPDGFLIEISTRKGLDVNVRVRLDSQRYGPAEYFLRLEDGQTLKKEVIRLRPLAALSGRVTDEASGRALADMPVHLHVGRVRVAGGETTPVRQSVGRGAESYASTVTGGDGRFLFDNVPATSGTVRVQYRGGDYHSDFTYEFSPSGDLDMGDLPIMPHAELAVRVIDRHSGEPLPDMEITFDPAGAIPQRTETTDSAGWAYFGHHRPRGGRLRMENLMRQVEMPEGPGRHEVVWEIGRAALGINLLDPGGVLDAEPFNVTVSASAQPQWRASGLSLVPGRTTWIEHVPAGEVHLTFNQGVPRMHGVPGNPMTYRTTRRVELGERREIDFVFPHSTVRGRIDVPEGFDPSETIVRLLLPEIFGPGGGWRGDRVVPVDGGGQYIFRALPPAEYMLRVIHPSLPIVERAVNMPEGDGLVLEENVTLHDAGRGTLVSVVLDAETMRPLPATRLFQVDQYEGHIPNPPLHDDEGVLVKELPAGTHNVVIVSPGHEIHRTTFEIRANETTHIETTLRRPGLGAHQ